MPTSFESAIPAELTPQPEQSATAPGPPPTRESEGKIKDYVISWRTKLKNDRLSKVNIWNECWQLYRGLEDWTDKEEWQSKIVIPKAWNSVKQATNLIKRLLGSASKPWNIESVNPDDTVTVLRAEQMTDLTRVFMDRAKYMEEFSEGLESGFITGVGIWKLWWGYKPRLVTKVVQQPMMGQDGRPVMGKQLVQQEVMEGQLFVRAVDPYNFYWLPGSKMNRWVGTVEDIEIPKWDLIRLANIGIFDPEKVKGIKPMKIDEAQKQSWLRHSERNTISNGPTEDTGVVKLTEYYGPVIIDGEIVREYGHIVIANDDIVLVDQDNPFFHKKAPYVGFSPLSLPFRTEGVGLVEMVRQIDRAISRLTNMSVDILMFKLLPLFEVTPDVYENPEDLETGMHPGKILRRNIGHAALPGIQPIQFEDISQGSIQVAAQLDRAHQEGALVSEIQQALPRFRGLQTATEIEAKSENQDSFFGNMAADIEHQALEPMIEMASDLIFQFIDTTTDPRVASVLGLGADVLRGMSREELMEMIQGDYKIKVTGLSGQLDKMEMLQNLVQLMNLIGQNPEAWLPYINQDALLRRILEAFRPAIHDIENIIADPETVVANKIAQQTNQMTPDMVAMIPQLVQMATAAEQQKIENARAEQEMMMQREQMQMQAQQAKAQAAAKQSTTK
jgi:hypothetical protein